MQCSMNPGGTAHTQVDNLSLPKLLPEEEGDGPD